MRRLNELQQSYAMRLPSVSERLSERFLRPLLIDRLEVLRGAGSTLYGSDALGGVIALHSRRPVAASKQ